MRYKIEYLYIERDKIFYIDCLYKESECVLCLYIEKIDLIEMIVSI